MMVRYALYFLGLLLAMPALALTVLASVTPITVSGVVYLIGCWLMIVGLIVGRWQPKYQLALTVSGIITLGLVASMRLHHRHKQTSNTKVIVLPSANETRWINWLIDEADSVLFGEGMLHLMGGVTGREHDQMVSALSMAYAQARSTSGAFPSLCLSTFLGFQKPAAFDAIVIEPAVERSVPIGVVFLHGFMGNVVLQCWQIAQAVEKIGAITVCPSTSWSGDWWQPAGEAIVRATMRYLRGRGMERFYLGGFSNGGHGIGSLAPRLTTEPGLRGLFFIAGVYNGAAIRTTTLPVLIMQGVADERLPVAAARRFAGELGNQATYVELEADHFLIVKQSREVQAVLRTWLEGRESR